MRVAYTLKERTNGQWEVHEGLGLEPELCDGVFEHFKDAQYLAGRLYGNRQGTSRIIRAREKAA